MGPKHRLTKKNLSFWIPVKKNKIHVAPKSKPTYTVATFQQALRVTTVLGQICSLLPVSGALSNNALDVRYDKKSWRIIFTVVSFIGQIYMSIMCLLQLFVHTTLKATTPAIFYLTTLVTMVMFIQVAKSWPNLVQHIAKTEELDPNFDTKLVNRCNITCAVVMLLALFEHILSLLQAFAAAMVCFPNDNLYEGFVKFFYPWVFNYIPYSPVLGVLTQYFHFQSTFIWNFSDLFVICMSYYLTSRLESINKRLLAAQGKYLPEVFWRSSREDYGRVTNLVRRIDDVISGVIFISFANNLFFVCLQLFNTLENANKPHILGGYEASVYFVFSLVFLISRSIAVSLIAAQVHSASTVPAPVLYDVPSPVYCVEVQRFLDQVNGEKVALSGLQFFLVTKGLLLTVAGTIVTYELVMVQFNSPTSSSEPTTTVLPLLMSSKSPT